MFPEAKFSGICPKGQTALNPLWDRLKTILTFAGRSCSLAAGDFYPQAHVPAIARIQVVFATFDRGARKRRDEPANVGQTTGKAPVVYFQK